MQFLVQIIVGVAIALVASFATNQLALFRFRRERMWERRAEAYSGVIEAMYDSLQFSDSHLEAEYENKQLSEEEDRRVRVLARNATVKINRAIAIGEFLMSENAIKRLKKYRVEQAHHEAHWMWFDAIEHDYKTTNECLRDLIAIARADLKFSDQYWLAKLRCWPRLRRRVD